MSRLARSRHGGRRRWVYAAQLAGVLGASLFSAGVATAQTYIWTGGTTGTQNWNVNGNWSLAGFPNVPGAVAALHPDWIGSVQIDLNQPITVGTLSFNDAGGGTPSSVTVASGAGTNALTLDDNGSGAQITIVRRNHFIAADVILAENVTVTTNGTTDGDLTISGSISGPGGIIKSGARTLVLSNTNTYSGPTTVSAGGLQLDAIGAVPGNITNNATLAFNTSGTYAGVVSGTGAVIKSSGGTLVFTSAQTYSGTTFVTGGTLQFDVLPAATSGISNTAAVDFNVGGTFAPVISGTGAVSKSGSGALTLTSANTYTGTTTVNGGTLALSGGGTLASTAGITLNNGGTFTIDNTTTNVANRVAGGGLTSNGGAFNFTHGGAAATNYAESNFGPLTLNAGALQINTSQAAVGQTSAVTFASVTRNAGGTVRLAGTGLGADTRNQVIFTTAPTPTNGILPWAAITTDGGTTYNFATMSGSSVVAQSTYTTTSGDPAWGATVNARPNGAVSLSGGRSLNSLVLDNGINLVGVGGVRTLTFTSGGVLQTGGTSVIATTGPNEYLLDFGASEAIFHVMGTLIHQRTNGTAITGTAGMTKTGPGTLELGTIGAGYAMSLTGDLTLNEGLLRSIGNNATQVGTAPIVFNGGNLEIQNSAATTYANALSVARDGTLTVQAAAPSTAGLTQTFGTLSLGAHTLSVAGGSNYASGTVQLVVGATTLTGNATLNVTDSAGGAAMRVSLGAISGGANRLTLTGNGDLVQTGAWSGAGSSFVMDGTGTATLSQANTYGGTTTVNAGALLINSTGSLSAGGGLVTVSGGTLGGDGVIDRAITVDGGVLDPGMSPGSGTGILTVGGPVTFASGAGAFTVQLNGLTAGSDYDQLLISGTHNVTLGGELVVSFGGSGWPTTEDYLYIINNPGTGTLSGTFSNYADGAMVGTFGGYDWYIYYNADALDHLLSGGNDVVITNFVVPEPGTLALLGLGSVAVLRRRRKKL